MCLWAGRLELCLDGLEVPVFSRISAQVHNPAGRLCLAASHDGDGAMRIGLERCLPGWLRPWKGAFLPKTSRSSGSRFGTTLHATAVGHP